MKTIAQQINWDFANGNLSIKDKNGNQIYYEYPYGTWAKYEYDSQQNLIYFQDSHGYWKKCKYDSNGNRIYFEDSLGVIEDSRIPQIIKHKGNKYKLIP